MTKSKFSGKKESWKSENICVAGWGLISLQKDSDDMFLS